MDKDTFRKVLLVVVVFNHSVLYDSVNPWTVAARLQSVHGIFQTRILKWVTISSWGSSRPRD